MQRRELIRQMAFITGAALLAPSCLQDKSKASILLKNMSIDGDQEKMLAELSESIIPATDTPGAKDVSAHLFALMMIDDCYKKEDRQQFIKGLRAFQTVIRKRFNKSFPACSVVEKETLLSEIDGKKTGNPELDYFYATVKKLTIQAYTSSKFYLTKVQVYELVPGHYYGCIPVNKAS